MWYQENVPGWGNWAHIDETLKTDNGNYLNEVYSMSRPGRRMDFVAMHAKEERFGFSDEVTPWATFYNAGKYHAYYGKGGSYYNM